MPRLSLAILIALAIAGWPVSAQEPDGARFTPLRADGNGIPALASRTHVSMTDVRLEEAVRDLLARADVGVVYDRDLPGLDRRVTLEGRNLPIAEALLRVLRGSELELRVSPTAQAVLVRRQRGEARGRVSGVVHEEGGEPVANARVQLVGAWAVAHTNDAGRFTLDVPAGVHELRVVRLGYRPGQVIGIEVLPDESAELDIVLDRAPVPLSAVVVSPGYFGVIEAQQLAARASLTREEIETNPQLGEDIFRAVTRLPGVTSYDVSAAFRVRGGPNSELLVRLDGLELLEPFHLKDFDAALGIIDVAAIGGIDLTTGGFGAQFGDRLTGVFDMRTVEPPAGRPRTALALTLTNLRAMSQGTFGGGDRGSWLVSARRGYIDYALKLADAQEDISPRYYDVLGKVQYRLGEAHVLSGHLLHAGDDTDFQDEDFDPSLRSSYGTTYGWLNWRWSPASGPSMQTVVSLGRLTWKRSGERVSFPDEVQDLFVRDVRSLDQVGARTDWSWDLGSRALLKWGLEARRASADYDYFAWHRHFTIEDDVAVPVVDTTDASLAPSGWSTGAYVAHRLQPWAPLTAELGVRYDHHEHTGDSDLSPRFNVAVTLSERAVARAAWGRYRQAHGLHLAQVQDGDTVFYPAESAEQQVVGLELSLPRAVTARIEAYRRDISNPRPRYENLANPLTESFPEALSDRRRLEPDRAEAKGLELFVKQSGATRVDWSASYALASMRDRIDGQWTPRVIDQRHTVYLDVAYRPSTKWRFSAGWQYHTGWPYTPFTFQIDTLRDGSIVVERIFGAFNSERLPAYHRLDLRATRHFTTKRGRVSVFLDLFNVYDRRNILALDYLVTIFNGPTQSVIARVQRDELIPRLPSFGVIWEF